MAWLNLTMPNQTVKNGLKAKKTKLPQMNFFLEKQLKFSCTYWPLSFWKNLKKFLGPIQSYGDVTFSTYWPIWFCKIFKKFLPVDLELVMRMLNFWAQNGPHFPRWEFFSKNFLMSLVPFTHAYLHAKIQSQIFIY